MNRKKITVLLLCYSILLSACGSNNTSQKDTQLVSEKKQITSVDYDSDTTTETEIDYNAESKSATNTEAEMVTDIQANSNLSLINSYKDKNCILGKDINYTNIGNPITADLNCDGKEETIILDGKESETGDYSLYSLTVNGKGYNDLISDLYLPIYNIEKYCIVDLNTTDSELEVAVPGSELVRVEYTYFFHFKDGELKYIGCIDALLDDDESKIYGDGTLSTLIDVELLENSKTICFYEMNQEKLVPKSTDWYYVDPRSLPDENKEHAILKDVIVYKENDLTSEKVTLTPADGPVTFPATDNKNWFILITKSGEIYYLYIEDYIRLSEDEFSHDFFDKLYIVN